jgi:integrase
MSPKTYFCAVSQTCSNGLQYAGVKPVTFSQYFIDFHGFIQQNRFVVEQVVEEPAHSKPEGKVKTRQATDELRFILYCGFHAGLRRKEIGAAKVSWFDLKAGLLHVANDEGFTSKDSENRTIPLTDEFLKFLKGFLSGRNANEFCLKHEHLAGRGKYRYDFQRTVRSHFRMLSVDLDIHGMRRSFASNLVSEGESIFIVAQWLGDGVQVVQKHYAYLAPHSGSINRLMA